MSKKTLTLKTEEFAKDLNLEILLEGQPAITLEESSVNRPGLQLSGYFGVFANHRIQLVGTTERCYMQELPETQLRERIQTICNAPIPCMVFAGGYRPDGVILEELTKTTVPVFLTQSSPTQISHRITNYIDRKMAPTISQHGVLLDVYGVGVYITGESGMGKSETALEIIKRGHRLVADDVVEITRVAPNRLSGKAPALTKHLMEIRGIGIIDVRYMYGVGAVIPEKSIDIVMQMEMWQDGKTYDRLGMEEEYVEILGVKVPKVLMPVRPGRNLAIIVEVAARNFRLKRLGYDAAKEFDRRWMAELNNR